MRLASLICILILSASCGQKGGESSSTPTEKGMCSLNGRSVACAQIAGADGLGIDLLDSMIDVPANVSDSEITFLADKSASSKGRRISCETSVNKGDIYRLALRGDNLLVMTPGGSYEMSRLTDGSGVQGTWSWKGYVDQGTHLIRNMTIIGKNRVIMRSSCEL